MLKFALHVARSVGELPWQDMSKLKEKFWVKYKMKPAQLGLLFGNIRRRMLHHLYQICSNNSYKKLTETDFSYISVIIFFL